MIDAVNPSSFLCLKFVQLVFVSVKRKTDSILISFGAVSKVQRWEPMHVCDNIKQWDNFKHLNVCAEGSIRTCRANQEVAAMAETSATGELAQFSELAQAKVLAIVGAGSVSPFDGNSWEDVMQHMVQTSWNGNYHFLSF